MSSALPSNWVTATVGDVARYINGLAFKPADWKQSGRPIIRIQNLTSQHAPFNLTDRVVDEDFIVRPGDILVSWSATLDAFRWAGPEAVLNQHIFKVIPDSSVVDDRFLFWGLKLVIREMWEGEHLHGSTMKHINRGPFLAHRFPLPPLNEQRRIVSKLEALLSRSRVARDALDALPAMLERLRQSVLAAAFRGGLTANWRAKNPDVEPASKLLERIRAERRRRLEEAELERMVSRGKAPKDDGWTARYEEMARVDTRHLPPLPDTWCWTSFAAIADSDLGKMLDKEKRTVGTPLPYLRNANVRWGQFDLTDLARMPFMDNEMERFRVMRGDILICEGGEPGRAAVWDSDSPVMMFQKALHRARPLGEISPWWIAYHLKRDAEMRALDPHFTGTTIKHFTGIALSRLPIRLAPLAEQGEIVKRLRDGSKFEGRIADCVAASNDRLATLERALLSAAFRGELVPQDPADEPASVLLERIRAERAAEGSVKGSEKKRRRSSSAA